MTGPSGDGRQMDDPVGRAADRLQHHHGIADRPRRDDLPRPRAAGDSHGGGEVAGGLRQAQTLGMDAGDGGAAGKRQAEGLGDEGHGAGGAHHHAGAGRGRQAAADRLDFGRIDLAGPEAAPEAAAIGAGAQHLALVMADDHRPHGDDHRRLVGADRPHHLGRQGLVAAADQHHGIHGLGADHLLAVHRHQIAQQHAGGMGEGLMQADGGKDHGQRAGEHDPALHRLDDLGHIAVAGIEIAMGIGDADDGPVQRVVGIAGGLDEGLAQEQREFRIAIAGEIFLQAARDHDSSRDFAAPKVAEAARLSMRERGWRSRLRGEGKPPIQVRPCGPPG